MLIGRPFLLATGLNFLAQLRHVSNDVDCTYIDEIHKTRVKIASTKYKGLLYLAADADPVVRPGCLAEKVGSKAENDIAYAFNKIIYGAKTNGVSEIRLLYLQKMLKIYRNVCRTELDIEAWADVPTLRITAVENAKPFRSPQRRYALKQRYLITRTMRELESVSAIYKKPIGILGVSRTCISETGV